MTGPSARSDSARCRRDSRQVLAAPPEQEGPLVPGRSAPPAAEATSGTRTSCRAQPPKDSGVQLRARGGARRPTRPSACNGLLAGTLGRRPKCVGPAYSGELFKPISEALFRRLEDLFGITVFCATADVRWRI